MKQTIPSGPEEFKQLSMAELNSLASTIREFLIDNISETGGHIGANLGVVELTIALHHAFASPDDRLIFDTGHQGYTHKLLTGRQSLFATLNQWRGMDRFISRKESGHDIIDASHAGTSISIASGIAMALAAENSPHHVVAVIGDGSMVEGNAFEGLNFTAGTNLRLIVVLNDNGMAIAPNVGGIRNLTGGENWQIKSEAFFRGLGYEYLPVPDGHSIEGIVAAMTAAKKYAGPVLVHVKTEKGRGLPCAKNHPYKMHFSMPFNPETGAGASPTVAGPTYAVVAAETLKTILQGDNDIFIITPATPYASSLDDLFTAFPHRVIDVGMAEQHAVTMACGLALGGKKPIVCFQTTFMQRAFDQLLHDACYMNLPVTFLGVRSGFSGFDSPTHHGLYDIPYLRSFPNMQVNYPVDSRDMRNCLMNRMISPKGPMVILHPYEPISETGGALDVIEPDGICLLEEGKDGLILTLGNRLSDARNLRSKLTTQIGVDFGLAAVRSIKPLPAPHILKLCRAVPRVLTMEEGTLPGGFGSLICELMSDNKINISILRSGVTDRFVSPGNKPECTRECGMDSETLMGKLLSHWPELTNHEHK